MTGASEGRAAAAAARSLDLRGGIIVPGDPDYDVAGAVWNGMVN